MPAQASLLTARPPLCVSLGCEQDTARFVALAGAEFTGVDALPETVMEPAPTAYTAGGNIYEVYMDNSHSGGGGLADAPVVASCPKRCLGGPDSHYQ
jgi:hypothetical protein